MICFCKKRKYCTFDRLSQFKPKKCSVEIKILIKLQYFIENCFHVALLILGRRFKAFAQKKKDYLRLF